MPTPPELYPNWPLVAVDVAAVEESMIARALVLTERKGYLNGLMAGIRLYAVWVDGVQYVGVTRRTLSSVLASYEEELRLIEGQLTKLILTKKETGNG